jgi:hypothetical protein
MASNGGDAPGAVPVFDPEIFDDRNDAALVELGKTNMEGRKIEAPL